MSKILGFVGIALYVLGWLPMFTPLPAFLAWAGTFAILVWLIGLIVGIVGASNGNPDGKTGALICGVCLILSVVVLVVVFIVAGAFVGAMASSYSM